MERLLRVIVEIGAGLDLDATLVNNALRHSGASRLTVEISVADMFILNVIDDGCGIPAGNTRHSGLANMKRRAEQLGGTCEITSLPAGGTRVHWVAPLIDH